MCLTGVSQRFKLGFYKFGFGETLYLWLRCEGVIFQSTGGVYG